MRGGEIPNDVFELELLQELSGHARAGNHALGMEVVIGAKLQDAAR